MNTIANGFVSNEWDTLLYPHANQQNKPNLQPIIILMAPPPPPPPPQTILLVAQPPPPQTILLVTQPPLQPPPPQQNIIMVTSPQESQQTKPTSNQHTHHRMRSHKQALGLIYNDRYKWKLIRPSQLTTEKTNPPTQDKSMSGCRLITPGTKKKNKPPIERYPDDKIPDSWKKMGTLSFADIVASEQHTING